MSNSYTKAAFGLTVPSAEADMLRRVVEAVNVLDDPNRAEAREAD